MNYFNYFSEIEELFVRRRGRNLLLSPLDWALIETWQEREVPLHIILSSIEKIFDSVDQQPAHKRTVKSLLYCKEEIEARYADWLDRQVGKNGAGKVKNDAPNLNNAAGENVAAAKSSLFSDDALISHLEKVSSEINFARGKAAGDFQQTLSEVSNRLAKLGEQPTHTAENLEESLEKLDAQIDQSLLRNFETKELKVAIEKQIASHKSKMEPEVYQRTFDLMLVKRLREQMQVPRLSLFYL